MIIQKFYYTITQGIEAIIFTSWFKVMVSIIAYYVLPMILALMGVFGLTSYSMYVQYGEIAMLLLLLLLFIKPVSIVFRIQLFKRILLYRRQMSIAMFWFALFHSIGLIQPLEAFNVINYRIDNFIMHGAVAMLGTGMLAMTSNKYSICLLKRNWKRLHYIAYPILFFTIIHADMATGEWTKTFIVIPLFIIFKILEYKHVTIKLPVIST